jgi:hypothetical protein
MRNGAGIPHFSAFRGAATNAIRGVRRILPFQLSIRRASKQLQALCTGQPCVALPPVEGLAFYSHKPAAYPSVLSRLRSRRHGLSCRSVLLLQCSDPLSRDNAGKCPVLGCRSCAHLTASAAPASGGPCYSEVCLGSALRLCRPADQRGLLSSGLGRCPSRSAGRSNLWNIFCLLVVSPLQLFRLGSTRMLREYSPSV